ncbi:hypothetical protein EHS25_004448 [Saitozyma podzolica]|jgi:hypothetical protein|uniref:Uncharacterized protein n=1 Tax=Saitozyma podzolica TaxID=1890683 RepID=A0A427YU31_9TREE|nr:hypothetical protein EHS25_004448 [Saitozyma podzolica]
MIGFDPPQMSARPDKPPSRTWMIAAPGCALMDWTLAYPRQTGYMTDREADREQREADRKADKEKTRKPMVRFGHVITHTFAMVVTNINEKLEANKRYTGIRSLL